MAVKGRTNNPNGRPKGSKNKVTRAVKERISQFIDNNFDGLQDEYDKLDSKDKLGFMKDLFPYVVPRMSATTAEVSIENKLKDLDENDLLGLAQAILEGKADEEG